MQSLAAGSLYEARQPDVPQPITHELRAGDDVLPENPRAGIEVEHEMVRLIEVVFAAPPRVDLQDAHLRERHETRDVVDRDGVVPALALPDREPAQRFGEPLAEFSLVEGLARQPQRTPHQAQRPLRHVRQDPVGHLLVVPRDVQLRHAAFGVHAALGVGDPHTGHGRVGRRRRRNDHGSHMSHVRRGTGLLRRCDGAAEPRPRRRLAHDVRRVDVFPQPLERRMPDVPLVGPRAERDLGDELGLDPVHGARLRIGIGVHERRRRSETLGELAVNGRERVVAEARADAPAVHEPAAGVVMAK